MTVRRTSLAEATKPSAPEPGIQSSMKLLLSGFSSIRTSMNPAFVISARSSSTGGAPAMHPDSAAASLRRCSGSGADATMSEIASRPPARSTRNASRKTAGLSGERLITQFETITSADLSGTGSADLVVSAGFLGGPRIAIFSGFSFGASGNPVHIAGDFFAFESTLRNGAFVALGTAIHHGDVFDRLVLVGCGAGFPNAAKTAFENMAALVEAGGMESVIPVALRRIFTEDYLEAHPEMGEDRT